MGLFRDAGEVYEIYATLFDLLGRDPRIGFSLANAGLIVQFRSSNPDGIVTLNMRGKPVQNGIMWVISSGNVRLNQISSSRLPLISAIDFSRGESISYGH